jgi:hypothetical protein
MNFFINNLAILLTIVAIAGTVGFFWACNTLKTGKTVKGHTSVVSGRFSCKSPNYSNIPKAMATYRNGFLR